MPISIAGSGTITGISAGGLPDDCITTAEIAANAVTTAKLGTNEASGLCKAWVNFNGTGTVAIRASYNVSSITDNGVGDYTVNFTTAMPDANYTIVSGMYDTNGTGNVFMTPQTWSTKAVGSVKVFTSNLQGSSNTVGRMDQAFVDVAIFR